MEKSKVTQGNSNESSLDVCDHQILYYSTYRNGSLLTHKLRHDVAVAPRSAAQIQDTKTLHSGRKGSPAAVESLLDFLGNMREGVNDDLRGLASRRACTRLEILARGQDLRVGAFV